MNTGGEGAGARSAEVHGSICHMSVSTGGSAVDARSAGVPVPPSPPHSWLYLGCLPAVGGSSQQLGHELGQAETSQRYWQRVSSQSGKMETHYILVLHVVFNELIRWKVLHIAPNNILDITPVMASIGNGGAPCACTNRPTCAPPPCRHPTTPY